MNFKNTPRGSTVDSTKVKLNWFNIPYTDQRFYWTPGMLQEVRNSGHMIKPESISFSAKGFRAMYDVQITLANNTKVDAYPTGDPSLWTYIDSTHKLPQRNFQAMNQSAIETNLCLNPNKGKCQLMQWECRNSTNVTSGHASADPSHMWIWPEDVEIVNQDEFREIQLSDSFSFKQDLNYPFMLMDANITPHAAQQDRYGSWTFPKVVNGRIEEVEVLWGNRSYYTSTASESCLQTDWNRKTWGVSFDHGN